LLIARRFLLIAGGMIICVHKISLKPLIANFLYEHQTVPGFDFSFSQFFVSGCFFRAAVASEFNCVPT